MGGGGRNNWELSEVRRASGSFGPGRNQDDVRRNKRANEQTTKGLWELVAGGLGQGSEKKEKTNQQHAGSGGNLLSVHQHFKDHPVVFSAAQKFNSGAVQVSQTFHFALDVLMKQHSEKT